jgi:hypothetical protein
MPKPVTVSVFALLVLLPLPVAYWLYAKDRRYDVVLEGPLDAQECIHSACQIDFDGDGLPGSLIIDQGSPAEYYDSWLVVKESNREVLRLPHRRIDNTLRTHAAVRVERGKAHLIVYDHIKPPGPPINAVFAWNGERMVQIPPSKEEEEILEAMDARDDAGNFNRWVIYRTAVTPLLILYYVSIATFIVWRLYRRRESSTRVPFPNSRGPALLGSSHTAARAKGTALASEDPGSSPRTESRSCDAITLLV